MSNVLVLGSFDDMRLADFRFLEEAAKLGTLGVELWSDELVKARLGQSPKFPYDERDYLLGAVRWVHSVFPPPQPGPRADLVVIRQTDDTPAIREFRSSMGMDCQVISEKDLQITPPAPPVPVNPSSSRKKVLVTGCYDWFHSGHVRFFEECSELGDLYVIVGHDANIRLLKGEGHPLFPATQRRYIVSVIRSVTGAFISSGDGWMDAEPEIEKIRPDIYAVNEDGDKPEKRDFCRKHGIEYKVLKRLPRSGLPRRQSTDLRGF